MDATTRIPEEQIEAAKQVDLYDLASGYTELHKASARDWAGPCPSPGCTAQKDGFHVYHSSGAWRWRCYTCHSKPGDAIEFVRWLSPGLTFPEAVAQLIGGNAAPQPRRQRRAAPRPAQRAVSGDFRQRVTKIVHAAQERLLEPEGEPGADYLLGRGLEPRAWLQYGLGYRPDVPLPGTQGKQRAPAIVMPWRDRNGAIYAVRYRFLETHTYTDADSNEQSAKQTAETGSLFGSKLYGSQGMPSWALHIATEGERTLHRLCTLVICEGEINAMSIWQAAGDTQLHVVSIGSESAQLHPTAAAALANQYGLVVVWADREQVAQRLMAALPGAVGVKSPGGRDANDLHQVGLLGGFLARVRADHAKSDDERSSLLWALYDAARLPAGIDTGSAHMVQRLAKRLGCTATIIEAEPGRWITP